MIVYLEHDSPLGPISLACSEHGICSIRFAEHAHFAGPLGWHKVATHPLLQQAAQQLDEYFAGTRQQFSLPLDAQGTPFQQQVWRGLQDIAYGSSSHYGALAQRIGKPKAVRALGAANGRNPISIVVPCHRVIGANGDLVGYAGGLERKRFLLALEARHAQRSLV